jgi:F1F0 ATPase subunit 2
MFSFIQFLLGVVFGTGIAAAHFGGLWWTTWHLPHARRPWRLYVGSLAVRLAIVLAGFYLLLAWGQWQSLAGGLVGFVATRQGLICWLSRASNQTPVEHIAR